MTEYLSYKETCHVHSFDGMGYNAIYGAPVVYAAKMLEKGASLDEILQYLTDILPRRQIYFGIYDLTYAAKCRGESKLIDRIVKMTINDMEPKTPYEIVYGNDLHSMEELQNAMIQKLGYEPASIYQIGAAVAANSGPKVVGVSFTRKKDL